MVTGTWVAFSVLGLGQGAMTGLTFDPIVASFINAIKIPALILFSGVFSAIAGFTAGFFAPIGNLYLQSNGRAREIGILMPDAVAFMHALSIGGMNQIQIFEALARADETYGEVSQNSRLSCKKHGTSELTTEPRFGIGRCPPRMMNSGSSSRTC